MTDQTTAQSTKPLTILLYSHNHHVREQLQLALGTVIAPDLPKVEYIEAATGLMARNLVKKGGIDLLILDGEANPEGGMSVIHQLKEELDEVPPCVLMVQRVQDAWLASWSRAEAISAYPIDPIRLPKQVAEVLRATR
ncbi:MAG: response regulator [Propionibacteriaceae bacterium]